MLPYATTDQINDLPTGVSAFQSIVAASSAIDARLRQDRALLAYLQTFRTTVIDGRYVQFPRPTTSESVAVISPSITIAITTVADALTVDGVRLAVDAQAIGAGGVQMMDNETVVYQWLGPFSWRFQNELAAGTAIWVDGMMGWGERVQQHAEGYADALSAGADTIANDGEDAPLVGTALQWDREVMAITSVVGTARDWTLTLARGLEGSTPAAHATTSTLYRLVPPAELNSACVLVAKRIADGLANPGQGPAFDIDGDPSTSFWRNVDGLLERYRRPIAA